jgi:uncharacterized membrane protein YgcG
MDFFVFANTAQGILLSYTDSVTTILFYSVIIGFIGFAILYAFEACALYSIAKREGYDKRWMAFVPILNNYYIGKVSEKNRVFNIPAKTLGLVVAILEGILVVRYILYYIALFVLADKGYLMVGYSNATILGETVTSADGFYTYATPDNLTWATWMATNLTSYLFELIDLVYFAFEIMLLIAFFQTYYSKRYLLFTICAIIFPVQGILMFVVRKNKGKNYRQFVREQQEMQYRAYQEYNRRNMNSNPYNYNPYSGRTQQPPTSNPYEAPKSGDAPNDPFDDFGTNSSNGNSNGSSNSGNGSSNSGDGSPSDPFGDL